MRKTVWLALAASLLTAGCMGAKSFEPMTSNLAPKAAANCIARNIDAFNPRLFRSETFEPSSANNYYRVGLRNLSNLDSVIALLHYDIYAAPNGSKITVYSSGAAYNVQPVKGGSPQMVRQEDAVPRHLKGCR